MSWLLCCLVVSVVEIIVGVLVSLFITVVGTTFIGVVVVGVDFILLDDVVGVVDGCCFIRFIMKDESKLLLSDDVGVVVVVVTKALVVALVVETMLSVGLDWVTLA